MDGRLKSLLLTQVFAVFFALARHAAEHDTAYHIEPLCRYPWSCQYGDIPRIKPNTSSK